MARLLITGSTGYIGCVLVDLARAGGQDVLELNRSSGWRIGAPLPPAIFDNVDAIIYLAHSWAIEKDKPEELNPIIKILLVLQKLR